MRKGWYQSQKAIIGYHIVFWILFLLYPSLVRMGMNDMSQHHQAGGFILPAPVNEFQRGFPQHSYLFEAIMLITDIYNVVVFYICSFLLIPRFFNKRLIWKFILFLFLLYAGFLFLKYGSHQILFMGQMPPPMFFLGFPFFFVVMLSIAYSLISEKIRLDREIQEKENANLKTELQFLRSQISPHFMFNVLNNIVAMVRKGSDQLEPSLIQLSGLMRYMLYEVKTDKVALTKEIEFLKIYIQLQQQRMKENVQVNFYMEQDPNTFFIEPMLLIPFVENAFKHSRALLKPEIDIVVILTKGKLLLQVKNNYDSLNCTTKEHTEGIGLANVKRRLQILYGAKSNLEIHKTDCEFQIQLHIEMG